jgi:hypothetical protein
MGEADSEQKPKSTRNKVVAAILFVSTLVAGLAAFKDNIIKLFGSSAADAEIVFKIVHGQQGEFQLKPTDPSLVVQSVWFTFAPAFGMKPVFPPNSSSIDLSPQLEQINAYIDRLRSTSDSLKPGVSETGNQTETTPIRVCQVSLPVLIGANFIGKDSEVHVSRGFYYLTYFEEMHPERPEDPILFRDFWFDHHVDSDEGKTAQDLNGYINNTQILCRWLAQKH